MRTRLPNAGAPTWETRQPTTQALMLARSSRPISIALIIPSSSGRVILWPIVYRTARPHPRPGGAVRRRSYFHAGLFLRDEPPPPHARGGGDMGRAARPSARTDPAAQPAAG